MPVGKSKNDKPLPIAGVRFNTIAAAVYYPDRPDIAMLYADAPSSVAGVFTQHHLAAAPVQLCRQRLATASSKEGPWVFLVNSGNANAVTGKAGVQSAIRTCNLAASALGLEDDAVLPFSTGLIGVVLPVEPFEKGMSQLVSGLHEDGWDDFARAIMTTDTRPKIASRRVSLSQGEVCITGVAKGSAMLSPNMATMFAFAATDARIDQASLQKLHSDAVTYSFNRITVDGDTSTNDSAAIVATGASGVDIGQADDASTFADALNSLYLQLALELMRDGEGATRCVEVCVAEGATNADCLEVAYRIANSPLVKAAINMGDPNWGRLAMAVGNAACDIDPARVKLWIGDIPVLHQGELSPDYNEDEAVKVMAQEEYRILVTLGAGDASERVWACDLSHKYIEINAGYRS